MAAAGHVTHGAHQALATLGPWPIVWGTLLHSAGYLVAAVVVAVMIYEVVGVRVLRKAWLNINLVWAIALIVTGVLTPML